MDKLSRNQIFGDSEKIDALISEAAEMLGLQNQIDQKSKRALLKNKIFRVFLLITAYMDCFLLGFYGNTFALTINSLMGGVIALVGPTGSGKSLGATLFANFMTDTLYDPISKKMIVGDGSDVGFIEFTGEIKAESMGIVQEIIETVEESEKRIRIVEILDGPITKLYCVIDEFNRIDSRAYPKGLFNILGDKRYNGKDLPVLAFILTFNKGINYQINELDPAIISRITIFKETQSFNPAKLKRLRNLKGFTTQEVRELRLNKEEKRLLNYITENFHTIEIPEVIYDCLNDLYNPIEKSLGKKKDHFSPRTMIDILECAQVISLITHLAKNTSYIERDAPSPKVSLQALKTSTDLILKGRFQYLGVVPDYGDLTKKIFSLYLSAPEFISSFKDLKDYIDSIEIRFLNNQTTEGIKKLGHAFVGKLELIIDTSRKLGKEYNQEILGKKISDNLLNPLSDLVVRLPRLANWILLEVNEAPSHNYLRVRMVFLRNILKGIEYVIKNRVDREFIKYIPQNNAKTASKYDNETKSPLIQLRDNYKDFIEILHSKMQRFFLFSFQERSEMNAFLDSLAEEEKRFVRITNTYLSLKLDFMNFAGADDFPLFKSIIIKYLQFGIPIDDPEFL